jgi:hypothetical protein
MDWSTVPMEIERTMLLMKGMGGLRQQKLLTDEELNSTDEEGSGFAHDAPMEPAKLTDLYQINPDKTMVGPGHRYKMYWSTGPGQTPVHISPGVIEFMAKVAAASRLVTDPSAVAKLGGVYEIVTQPEFTDPVTRLKIITSQLPAQAAVKATLIQLGELLQEGTSGISMRDLADAWLTQSIARAQLPQNGNCLTPQIAKEVFMDLLRSDAIHRKSHAERNHWENLIRQIGEKFVVPELTDDVMLALGTQEGDAESTYLAAYFQWLAPADATKYEAWDGTLLEIDRGMLASIEKAYFELYNQKLETTMLMNFHSRYAAKPGEKKDPKLMAAIRKWMANLTMSMPQDGLITYAETGKGSSKVREQYDAFSHVMDHRLGYCKHCRNFALRVGKKAPNGRTTLTEK